MPAPAITEGRTGAAVGRRKIPTGRADTDIGAIAPHGERQVVATGQALGDRRVVCQSLTHSLAGLLGVDAFREMDWALLVVTLLGVGGEGGERILERLTALRTPAIG